MPFDVAKLAVMALQRKPCKYFETKLVCNGGVTLQIYWCSSL